MSVFTGAIERSREGRDRLNKATVPRFKRDDIEGNKSGEDNYQED
jgi:hypothetical protein